MVYRVRECGRVGFNGGGEGVNIVNVRITAPCKGAGASGRQRQFSMKSVGEGGSSEKSRVITTRRFE